LQSFLSPPSLAPLERESLSSSSQNSASGFKHNKQNTAWKIFKHKTGHRNLLSSNPCISFSSCYNFQTAETKIFLLLTTLPFWFLWIVLKILSSC
jgi:hypothetical protein